MRWLLVALVFCLAICIPVSQAIGQQYPLATTCGTVFYNQPPVPGQIWTVFLPLLYQGYPISYYYYFDDDSTNQGTGYQTRSISNSNLLFLEVLVPAGTNNGDSMNFYLGFSRYDPVTNREICNSYSANYFLIDEIYGQPPLLTYPLQGVNIGYVVPVHSTTGIAYAYCYGGSPSTYTDNNNNYLLVCPATDPANSFTESEVSSGSQDYFYDYVSLYTRASFGPTNFQESYTISLNNVRTINFNTIYTSAAYVSYTPSSNMTYSQLNNKVRCQVRGISGTQQFVKCPGPLNINKRTNLLLGRFEFHTANGLQEEGWAQIIVQ